MTTSIVFRITKVTPQIASRGERVSFASLISFRISRAVIPRSMHRCFCSFWISIWWSVTVGLVTRWRLMAGSTLVWLVEASGVAAVADGEAFAGAERFGFEDDRKNFWNRSGILIPSRL